jgi:hypothetical protein
MPPQHQSASVIADPKTILKELEQHNAFFDDLVDMIPAKLYVAGNSGAYLLSNSFTFTIKTKQWCTTACIHINI